MTPKRRLLASENVLDQVAGITGLGWTASLLGYLSSVIGYSNHVLPNPQSLLYLGGILLVTTLGLDRLKETLASREK